MSVLNFPTTNHILVVDTSSELYLGSFDIQNNTEIEHIVLRIFKKGAHSTTEQFRLKIYKTSDRSDTPIISATRDVADITSLTSSSWLGRVRFDFNRETVNTVSTYYVTLDPVTYTKTGDTFYFAAVLDNPISVNTNNTPQAAASMEIWGRK